MAVRFSVKTAPIPERIFGNSTDSFENYCEEFEKVLNKKKIAKFAKVDVFVSACFNFSGEAIYSITTYIDALLPVLEELMLDEDCRIVQTNFRMIQNVGQDSIDVVVGPDEDSDDELSESDDESSEEE